MDNHGAVFVAAVIERDTWNANVSLVGHENTIQVASYNPRLFQRNPDIPLPMTSPSKRSIMSDNRSINDTPTKRSTAESPSKQTMLDGSVEDAPDEEANYGNVFSVVALGADDRSISIWRTIDARPLVVAKEAFDRQIMDLSWANDGKSVWACSSDGTIAVLDFAEVESYQPDGSMLVKGGEMKGLASAELTKDYLKMFDFPWPPPIEANNRYQPNGYPPNAQAQYQHSSYVAPSYGSGGYHKPAAPSMGTAYHPRPIMPTPQASVSSPGHVPPPINQAQKVTVTKSGKKRIQPTFLGGGSAVTTSSSNAAMHPPLAAQPTTPTQANMYRTGGPQYDSGMDWAPDNGGGYGAGAGSSRHGRTHSSSRQPENGYGNILPGPNVSSPRRHSVSGRRESLGNPYVHGLQIPPFQNFVAAGVPGQVVLECRNSEDRSGSCCFFRCIC
jgi:protein HIRA/HIR1